MSDPLATLAAMQSMQARQRKLERKRRKREERQRSFHPRPPLEVGPRPDPEMPYTLIKYAWPLIQRLPRDQGPEELKEVLLFASLVWNAVIEQEGDPAETLLFLARSMRRELHRTPPHLVVVVGALAYRKAECFGADAPTAKSCASPWQAPSEPDMPEGPLSMKP
jgi:hypothetical protein